MKIITTNRELNYKYEVIDTYICGIELKGTEIKSVKDAKINIKDGFALISNGEVFLKNVYIAPFEKGSYNNVKELRDRKLLMHKGEIIKLLGKVNQGGYTLIPYKVGFVGQYVKVELALCKGKKLYDKRESMKKKDAIKKIAQVMKG